MAETGSLGKEGATTASESKAAVELACAAAEAEEIPSLDVLSFEHEVCLSQNCLCRSKKHQRDAGDGVGVPAFGVRGTVRLPLKRQLEEVRADVVAGHPQTLLCPPVFCPLTKPSVVVGSPVAGSPEQVASRSQNSARLFGAKQDLQTDVHSFAQLSADGSQSAASQDTGNLYQTASFQNCQHSSTTASPSSAARNCGLDLSDLQSVLKATAEETLSESSSCPVHRQFISAGSVPACTCSQQASRFDDWTVDELAGYFDDFCYIPKKMCVMAEMMYM